MFLVEQFFLCDIVSLVLGFNKLRITPLESSDMLDY